MVLLNNVLPKEYYLAAEAREGLLPHSPAHTNSPACTYAAHTMQGKAGLGSKERCWVSLEGEEQGTTCKLEMALGEEA